MAARKRPTVQDAATTRQVLLDCFDHDVGIVGRPMSPAHHDDRGLGTENRDAIRKLDGVTAKPWP